MSDSINLEHEKLYVMYWNLGPSRTLVNLAKISGVKLATLHSISGKNKWRLRVIEDTESINTKELGTDLEKVGTGELSNLISRKTLEKLYQALNILKVTSVKDAKTLLEIYLLVAGKPTEIIKTEQVEGTALPEGFIDSLTDKQLEHLATHVADNMFSETN